MNRLALFGITALTISAFADDEVAAQQKSSMNRNEAQKPEPMVNVLTSAAVKSENGWYLFGDVLYWHADVGNADWGWKETDTSDNSGIPINITGVNHALDFKWSWGFKVGIGMNMDHDGWDSNLYYTWFNTENSNAIGTEPDQIATVFIPSFDTLNSAKLSWSIHFSMFDWELGRWYYVSKNLALRPHVGVKGGWIHQTRHQHFSLVQDQQGELVFFHGSGKFTNDFWGVGPSAGVNTLWILGNAGVANDHRFCFFGDVGGALMYGHFDNGFQVDTFNEGGASVGATRFSNLDRNLAVGMLQANMGFSWDTAFNRGRNHFTFKAGYELQFWFDQNQFVWMNEITDETKYHRYDSNLKLQGLTFDFRFDF